MSACLPVNRVPPPHFPSLTSLRSETCASHARPFASHARRPAPRTSAVARSVPCSIVRLSVSRNAAEHCSYNVGDHEPLCTVNPSHSCGRMVKSGQPQRPPVKPALLLRYMVTSEMFPTPPTTPVASSSPADRPTLHANGLTKQPRPTLTCNTDVPCHRRSSPYSGDKAYSTPLTSDPFTCSTVDAADKRLLSPTTPSSVVSDLLPPPLTPKRPRHESVSSYTTPCLSPTPSLVSSLDRSPLALSAWGSPPPSPGGLYPRPSPLRTASFSPWRTSTLRSPELPGMVRAFRQVHLEMTRLMKRIDRALIDWVWDMPTLDLDDDLFDHGDEVRRRSWIWLSKGLTDVEAQE